MEEQGRVLTMSRVCGDCGRRWDASAEFCGGCGAPLTTGSSRPRVDGPGAGPRGGARRWWVAVGAVGAAGVAIAMAMTGSGPSPESTGQDPTVPGAIDLPTADGASQGSEPDAVPADIEGLDACDGAGQPSPCVRWVQSAPGTSWTGPAPVTRANADVLVVGGQQRVRGVDATSGQLRWTAAAAGSVAIVRHVGDGIVLVQDELEVRALDLGDGNLRWSVDDATILRTRIHAEPVTHVLLGAPDGSVTSHDPDDGTVAWTLADAGMPHTFVPLRDGLLLVGTQVVDATTGRKLWDTRTPVPTGTTEVESPTQVLGRMPLAAWSGGLLVAQGSHEDPTLILREAANGAPIAVLPVDGSRVRAVAVVHDHLVVRTDAETMGYSLAEGSERWRRNDERGELVTTAEVTGPYPGVPGMTVPARALVLRLPDGQLLMLDERNGQLQQRLGEPDPSGLDLGDGTVTDSLVAKVDNEGIQVFDLEDGRPMLDAPLPQPEIITTSPLVILSSGRLIGITLATDG